MGLSGGTNTFNLSGDIRDPTAVVLARVRKAQFAPHAPGGVLCGPFFRASGRRVRNQGAQGVHTSD